MLVLGSVSHSYHPTSPTFTMSGTSAPPPKVWLHPICQRRKRILAVNLMNHEMSQWNLHCMLTTDKGNDENIGVIGIYVDWKIWHGTWTWWIFERISIIEFIMFKFHVSFEWSRWNLVCKFDAQSGWPVETSGTYSCLYPQCLLQVAVVAPILN